MPDTQAWKIPFSQILFLPGPAPNPQISKNILAYRILPVLGTFNHYGAEDAKLSGRPSEEGRRQRRGMPVSPSSPIVPSAPGRSFDRLPRGGTQDELLACDNSDAVHLIQGVID